MPRRVKGRGSPQDQNMPHFNISYGGGSVEGEAVETTKQLVKYEKYVKGKVPGGTLNTGGRAGRVLLKEHLVGAPPSRVSPPPRSRMEKKGKHISGC